MKINKIITKTIFTGLLTLLSSTKIKADEIPKMPIPNPAELIYSKNMLWDDKLIKVLGYDTDNDGWEDLIYFYECFPVDSFSEMLHLSRYGIDFDRDHCFTQDEMFDPPIKKEEDKIKELDELVKR